MSLSRRNLLFGAATLQKAQGKLSIDGSCLARIGIICRTCADVCPQSAIRVRPLPGGRANPEVEFAACDRCGQCAQACPAGAIGIGSPALEAAHG